METIVVAFSGARSAGHIAELLESSGTARCILCRSCAEVRRLVEKQHLHVILCGFKMADGTAEELYDTLPDNCSMLMIANQVQLDMCEEEDILKLAAPVSRGDLIASVRVLLQLQRRLERASRPQRSPEEQAVIQRAKELLMSANQMDEGEAHRFLQRRSMESGVNMVDTAKMILDEFALE